MKRQIAYLIIAAACAVQASCSLQPEPGWAPSPPAEVRPSTPWGPNWAAKTQRI